MSSITTSVHRGDMTDVRSIVVSDIVQQADGTFLRAVRFYGDPVDPAVSSTPLLLLEAVCRSANKSDLVVATPAAGF